MLIKCYNYANKEFSIQDEHKEEDISMIDVTVTAGDEIIEIYWDDNTQLEFDTGGTNRFVDYYDGQYTIKDKEKIHKWLNWTGTDDRTYSYMRMGEFA